jgi:ABC-type transporter Mla subunit MlaD
MAVVLAVGMGFLISTLIELRRVTGQAGRFLSRTDDSLDGALNEIGETARSVRRVADDINSLTGSAREFSSAVADSAEDVSKMLNNLRHLTSRTSGRYLGLKAGIKAALEVLINNLFEKGGRK